MPVTRLWVEIMDTNSVWQDYTGDFMDGTIEVGFAGRAAQKPKVGKCTLLMNNSAATYTPNVAFGGISTGAVESRRRIRIRANDNTLGNNLRMIANGTGSSIVSTPTNDTISVPQSTLTTTKIGYFSSSSDQKIGQFWTATRTGTLTGFTVAFGANGGTPTGTVTWEMRAYDPGNPTKATGPILATGTFTPVASATTTVSGLSMAITAGTQYVLYMYSTNTQTSGNWWNVNKNTGDTYAGGVPIEFKSNVWFALSGDLYVSFTQNYNAISYTLKSYWSQVVSSSTAVNDVWTLQWDARSQYDSQYNSDVVEIVTSGETSSPQQFTYTNKWATYKYTYTAAATGTTIEPRWFPLFNGNGANNTPIDYRNITLTKNGGANVLSNSNPVGSSVSPWAATNVTGSIALSIVPDSWIIFNGVIEDIKPAPFAVTGMLTAQIKALDFVDVIQNTNINQSLLKSQRSDQLFTTWAGYLPSGTLNTTMPGKQFDTGKQTFAVVGDTYTQDTTLDEPLFDTAVSEMARWYVDRDGTLRGWNRTSLYNIANGTVKLALSTGNQAYGMNVQHRTETVFNKCVLTIHPRYINKSGSLSGGYTVIAQQNSPILLPGGGTATPVTLTYRDATGNVVGGDTVQQPLTPTTDYTIFQNSDGSGANFTSSGSITLSYNVLASQITITFTNNLPIAVYVTFLQVRGFPVYTYDPITFTVTDATSAAQYQTRKYSKDLPYASDQVAALAIAQYYVNQYKYPFSEAENFWVDAKAQLNGVALFSLEIGDLVTATDIQGGLPSASKHMINSITYELSPAMADFVKRITFNLERIDSQSYWLLGVAGKGELGTATYLYI